MRAEIYSGAAATNEVGTPTRIVVTRETNGWGIWRVELAPPGHHFAELVEMLFYFRDHYTTKDEAIEQAVSLVLGERETGKQTEFEFAWHAVR